MADHFIVRPIHSHDVPAIIHLHATLLPLSYPPSFFLHLLVQPSRVCLVAHVPNQRDPVAFVSAAMHPEQRIQILTLGVLPTFRKHRLATRLVYAAIDTLAGDAGRTAAAATVFAQVSTSNGPANSFYKHMGLQPSPDVLRDMYRILPCGSRDAYIVSGRITPKRKEIDAIDASDADRPVISQCNSRDGRVG